MAIHSVFGTSAPAGSYSYGTDGGPTITTGNVFYIKDGDGFTDPPYECIGGKAWFPLGQASAPTQVVISLYAGPITASGVTADVNMHSMDPVRQATVAVVPGGWAEASWEPYPMPRTPYRCMITAHYPDQPGGYVFFATAHPATGTVDSATAPSLAWTDDQVSGVGGPVYQSFFRIGTPNQVSPIGNGDTASTGGYSTDIIVRDSGTAQVAYVSAPQAIKEAVVLGTRESGTAIGGVTAEGWWDGSVVQPFGQIELDPPGGDTPVRFTVTGATFEPKVYLKSGSTATATWTVEEGGATVDGLSPTISFGSTGLRHVNLWIHDGSNNNRMNHAVVMNVGFDHTADAGKYYPGAALDHPQQNVTKIEYLNSLTALTTFCADNNPLGGSIDFSGMDRLQFIECYMTNLTSVDLTQTTALVRLCLEACMVETLDINPVYGSLRDLRAAAQRSALGHMTFAPQTETMTVQYHYCVRDQPVVNPVPLSMMPMLEEYYNWNTGIVGAFVIPAMERLWSIELMNNTQMTSVDASAIPTGRQIGNARLHVHDSPLTNLIVGPGIGELDASYCQLPQSVVDSVLATFAGGTNTGGVCNLSGTGNAAPSSAGLTSKDHLINVLGWTVTTN